MTAYKIAILGAGLGGLGLAARLKMSGESSFVILEKAEGVGGTWRDNTYPGCACDIPSHLYWYSFDRPPNWSRVFPSQPEILRNIESFVSRRQLANHIRFKTVVSAADWDEKEAVWRIHTASSEAVRARSFVAAWGQLSRPKLPGIEGCDRFTGTAFHSAQWRHDVDLDGKRIACIGTGASAVQIIPEIALKARHLTVFQRSPNYVMPRRDRAYSREERRAFGIDVEALRASREAIYLDHENRYDAIRLGSERAAKLLAIAKAHMRSQVQDPALREKLWPDYPLGCKRILLSDDFYPALSLPNVELVPERITAIEPSGVRTAGGQLHQTSIIIYATGFETTSFLGPLEVTGRGGRSLRQQWRDGPSAYLGITVPGFPNFFLLYGPNTNLVHNSIIAMLECQFGYVMEALRILDEENLRALEVCPTAMERFCRELEPKLHGTAWAAGCTNWYKTAEGRLTNNWPGTVEEYKARTAGIASADYGLPGDDLRSDSRSA
jgi:cation diffusion facilitator CzcD-associated flavoprotein CzcO